MNKPGISCFCSTYGRPKSLIENSIQCFLEQDYTGPKELVILNDLASQKLIYNHPEVRIINLPERIKPLSRKFNMNVELCKYDIIAVWEDDDVFLKNRLSYAYANMIDGIFHSYDGFFEKKPGDIIVSSNYYHSQHVFTKDLFNAVGGYPETDFCTLDLGIMQKFKDYLGYHYSKKISNPKDLSYIYVWSESNSFHGSGLGEKVKISDQAEKIVAQQVQQGKVLTGNVLLEPKLRYDFYKFLPFNLVKPNLSDVKVLYGIEGFYIDITEELFRLSNLSEFTLPTCDYEVSKIFGDPKPNYKKHLVIQVFKAGLKLYDYKVENYNIKFFVKDNKLVVF